MRCRGYSQATYPPATPAKEPHVRSAALDIPTPFRRGPSYLIPYNFSRLDDLRLVSWEGLMSPEVMRGTLDPKGGFVWVGGVQDPHGVPRVDLRVGFRGRGLELCAWSA